LTFVTVLANECVVAAIARARSPASLARRLRAAAPPLAVFALILAALLAYGRVRRGELAERGPEPLLTAAAIQAGVSDYPRLRAELGTYDAVRLILDAHFDLSVRALGGSAEPIDLLVWPETVYPTTYGAPKSEDGAAFDREIERFVASQGVPLVFGTYGRVGDLDFNAAAFLELRGDGAAQVAAYLKQRLFPFTERVPALLDHEPVRRALPWLGTWRPGTGPAVVDAPLRGGRRLRVAPLVCYDAVDPELSAAAAERGAELLLVLSNDSWFAHGGGPHGHLVVSAFRSVETGLPQLRATNTGISAVIDASGEILTSLDTGERGALVAAIPPGARERPWAVAVVPFVGPASLLLALVSLVSAGRRRR
jgi:apolipoprotein N-acyltransferase